MEGGCPRLERGGMNDVMARTRDEYIANKNIQSFLINFLSQVLLQIWSCDIYQNEALRVEHYIKFL